MEHLVWNIDPNIFTWGGIQLRWYGLLFVASFFLGLSIMTWIYKREGRDPIVLDAMLLYIMAGAVIGSRLMHCFAYEPSFYLANPIEILKVWKGGLASHGGMLGVIFALYLFSLRYKESFGWLLGRITIVGALTASFVRFGNFFNSEILGKPSDLPWAIVFERVDSIPRHPVQLYEGFAYLFLVLILWLTYRAVSSSFASKILPAIFLTYMFIVRFLLEYSKTRQADYVTDLPFSTGQMLSLPFIIMGIVWLIWAVLRQNKEAEDKVKKTKNLKQKNVKRKTKK